MAVASSVEVPLGSAILMTLVGVGYGLWLVLLAVVFEDLAGRGDLTRERTALCCAVVLLVPLGGVLGYVVMQRSAMAQRRPQRLARRQARLDAHVRAIAGAEGYYGITAGTAE